MKILIVLIGGGLLSAWMWYCLIKTIKEAHKPKKQEEHK